MTAARRREILDVVRRHAQLPDTMLWAELGIKVPEARALVAHVEQLERAVGSREQ